MNDFLVLLLLSIAMFIGSYGIGMIPLAFNLSESRMRLMTVLGAGLLAGTALSVIVPEGVAAVYDSPRVERDSRWLDEHQAVGATLVLGFVFMLLVDQLGAGAKRVEAGESPRGFTASLGLVVHAAADGVALGAAASTSRQSVEFIVFAAVMLHKGPASFGLASFLLHEKFERQRVRRHLAVFALAAPVLAIITYLMLIQQTKASSSTWNATGLAMLFSAGTFLYVATVHVLPELVRPVVPKSTMSVEEAGGVGVVADASASAGGFTCLEVCVNVIGCCLPLLLSFGHSHDK